MLNFDFFIYYVFLVSLVFLGAEQREQDACLITSGCKWLSPDRFPGFRRGRVPLSDNTVIEKSFLGEIGIICVEDLVHEISTCGDNFAKAAKFLYPFQLTKVGDGIQRHMLNEKKHNKGGEVDMDAFINDAL